MNSVNKTLYIPLYGKSYVSKKGLFLDDKKAEEIWKAEGFSLKRIFNSLMQGKLVIFISSQSESFRENPFSKGDRYVLAVTLTKEDKVLIANTSTNGIYEIGKAYKKLLLKRLKNHSTLSPNPFTELGENLKI